MTRRVDDGAQRIFERGRPVLTRSGTETSEHEAWLGESPAPESLASESPAPESLASESPAHEPAVRRNRAREGIARRALLPLIVAFAPAVHAQTPLQSDPPRASQDGAAREARTYAFEIAAQPLAAALLELGRQADLSVLAPADLVEGRMAPAVSGAMGVAVALDRLLAGSELDHQFVSPSAVRIVSRSRASAAPLSPAMGQLAELVRSEDRVVVTGTSISGLYPDFSPVEIYGAEAIEQSGAVTTEQFIARLPQNLARMQQYAAGTGTLQRNQDSVAAVDLRGLGVGTTLTLLNGRRMALSISGQTADISMVPLGAIERIEVLTDGASAIYGSDAIGGVVNFVLRKDFEGSETRLGYGGVDDGGLRQGGVSHTMGTSWSGGSGLAAYNFHSARPLQRLERDYAAAAGAGTMTPLDQRHNLFATATQAFGDRLSIGMDVGVARRKVKNASSNVWTANPVQWSRSVYGSTTESLSAAIGGAYELPPRMTASFDLAWARVEVDADSEAHFFNATPVRWNFGDHSTRHESLELLAKLEGVAFQAPAGNVRFALGGGVRQEDFTGFSPLSGQQSPSRLGRRSPYLFGEVFAPLVAPHLEVPLVRRFELSLAARYTDYDDTSAPALHQDFGDSIDPKVGLLWEVVDGLRLRSTYGTSFRAPSLTQLDPVAGVHQIININVAGQPSVVINLSGYAAPGLGPETAHTYTLGFDFEPAFAPRLRLRTTYFNIDYDNRIGQAPTGGLSPFAAPHLLPDVIYRAPSAAFIEAQMRASRTSSNAVGVDLSDLSAAASTLFARPDLWIYDRRYNNLAISKQDGLDLSVSHGFTLPWGEVSWGASATHILDYRQQGSPNSQILKVFDAPGEPPDWRGRIFASLAGRSFTVSANLNYVDDYADVWTGGGARVESWTTLDAALSYRLGGRDAGRGEGARLTLSVQNVFDLDPPALGRAGGQVILAPIGFDPINANPLGRNFMLGLVHRW